MKIPRFRNGRSQEYAQLLQSIKSLESAAASLASEVASARGAAASADQSARTLRHRLDELEKEEDRAGQPWRVFRLAALCAALLVLAGGLTYTGVKGFADPRAVPSGMDSIMFLLRIPSPTTGQLSTSDVAHVYATFTQDSDNNAFYQIFVPPKYAGKQYALMLIGTARIDDPTGYEPFQSRFTVCSPPPGQCQLITGRIPSEADVYFAGADVYDCQKWPGGSVGGSPVNAIEMDFEGTARLSTASDWAYQKYSLPAIWGLDPEGNLADDVWSGIPLGGWYEYVGVGGCVTSQPPENMDLTDMYAPATQSSGNQWLWVGPSILSDAFVARRRNADEIGNALLATGAAMAALAIGFIPVTYDADRERRRARKRRRARQGSTPPNTAQHPA